MKSNKDNVSLHVHIMCTDDNNGEQIGLRIDLRLPELKRDRCWKVQL